MKLGGVWLPIITPFINDAFDEKSYEELINYYIPKGISGLIPLGTTGECPVITEGEFERIVDKTVEIAAGRVPIYVGLGGNFTRKVLKSLKTVEKYDVNGILSVCPYYNRPGQDGLFRHFLEISEHTDLNIIIYNIPYRTGVNLQNDTLFKLAEARNIVAVKDSCGVMKQSLALISQKPDDFSVLTGEDALFYTTVANGGDGGILASSHLRTESFVAIHELLNDNDHHSALSEWRNIEKIIPLLFEEPNPAPLKYCLDRMNLIRSPEIRLPLTDISDDLKERLALEIER